MSGPLLDRIDIVCEVEPVDLGELIGFQVEAEPSEAVRHRVVAAREVQAERWRHLDVERSAAATNAALPAKLLANVCPLTRAQRQKAEAEATELGISARGWHRVLRVARTIADLAGRPQLEQADLAEAFHYRRQGDEMTATAALFTPG